MKILFSPIGDTDPIRNCFDGGMLHISRYYKPDLIILYLTYDMVKKHKEKNLYVPAIKAVLPNCKIEVIETDIKNPHIFTNLVNTLPKEVYSTIEKYPDAELFLNLSSGTPQIKMIMGYLTIELESAKVHGIQVQSPQHGSNRNNHVNSDNEDVYDLIENNLDNEESSDNRCFEPKLSAIKLFGLRNKIISLIQKYEYKGALDIYNSNKNLFNQMIGKLLKHADYRKSLMFKEARQELNTYHGKNLFRIEDENARKLSEFFLVMQLYQKNGMISDLLMKMTPFLFEISKYYLKGLKIVNIDDVCEKTGKNYKLIKNKLLNKEKDLFNYLDNHYNYGFRDSDLSFSNILFILQYITDKRSQELKSVEEHKKLVDLFCKLRKVEKKQRNNLAHTIENIDEKKLIATTNISSKELIDMLYNVMKIVFKDDLDKFSNIYDKINDMIMGELKNTN